MKSGAFDTTFLTGADYVKWVETEEKRHETLMKEAGFLSPRKLIQPESRAPSPRRKCVLRIQSCDSGWSFHDHE